jgi:hypothetical protein
MQTFKIISGLFIVVESRCHRHEKSTHFWRAIKDTDRNALFVAINVTACRNFQRCVDVVSIADYRKAVTADCNGTESPTSFL